MKRLTVFLLAIIAIVGATQNAKAQDGTFAVGVAGEMSSKLLKGDNCILAYGGVEVFANYKFDFGSRFFVLPELAIAQRWHRSSRDCALIGYYPGVEREDLRSVSSLFAVRPNVGINIIKNLNFITGPEMDWIFAQNHKVRYTDYNEPDRKIHMVQNKEKKMQWGWNVGALADIKRVRVGVTYMIRIGAMMYADDKPGTFRISVGYRF